MWILSKQFQKNNIAVECLVTPHILVFYMGNGKNIIEAIIWS